jgi:DNA anti-recombination protein RmuC
MHASISIAHRAKIIVSSHTNLFLLTQTFHLALDTDEKVH